MITLSSYKWCYQFCTFLLFLQKRLFSNTNFFVLSMQSLLVDVIDFAETSSSSYFNTIFPKTWV